MKTIVQITVPPSVIQLSAFDYNFQFVGMKREGEKYILVPKGKSSVTFANLDGGSHYGSFLNANHAIKSAVENFSATSARNLPVEVFVFEDGAEMANWMLAK